jgi:hypothetical protein
MAGRRQRRVYTPYENCPNAPLFGEDYERKGNPNHKS